MCARIGAAWVSTSRGAMLALGVESVALGLWRGDRGQARCRTARAGVPTDFVVVAGGKRAPTSSSRWDACCEGQPGRADDSAGCHWPLCGQGAAASAPAIVGAFGSLPPASPASFYADVIHELHAHSLGVTGCQREALRLGCMPALFGQSDSMKRKELTAWQSWGGG
jgi:hypothetical protein